MDNPKKLTTQGTQDEEKQSKKYIHCNKYQNFNKFQPTDSEL
jgi:hypothetical protein